MIYLKHLERKSGSAGEGYPYDTPLFAHLDRFAPGAPVTLLCGDNGCGKTTLIELIAAKLGVERVGPLGGYSDSQRCIRQAADGFRVAMAGKPAHSFLFTAEGFTKYVDYVVAEKRFAREELDRLPHQYGSDYARGLASQPYAGTLQALNSLYDRPLERQSHGQGFLDFFQSRLHPKGLYLMDEPEAALSYVNQLALIYIMQEAVAAGSQFILATHSPILSAYPDAALFEIQDGQLMRSTYDDLHSIQFLRHFLRSHAHILNLNH